MCSFLAACLCWDENSNTPKSAAFKITSPSPAETDIIHSHLSLEWIQEVTHCISTGGFSRSHDTCCLISVEKKDENKNLFSFLILSLSDKKTASQYSKSALVVGHSTEDTAPSECQHRLMSWAKYQTHRPTWKLSI